MMSSDLFITWSYVFVSNLDQFILYSDWQGIKLGRRIFTVFWMWHRCRVRCNAMVVSNTSHVMQVSIVKFTNKNTNTNSNTVVAWNISLVVRAIMLTHPWPQQDTDNLQSASCPHFRYKYNTNTNVVSNTSKVLQALCPHFRSFNHVIYCVSRTMEPMQFRAEQQCLHKRVEWVLRAGKTFMHPSLTCVSGLEVYFKSCQREKYFWRWNSILSTPWSSDWSSEYCNVPIFSLLNHTLVNR